MINLFPAHFLGNEKIKIAEQGGGSNSSWPWDLTGVTRFWDREECLSVFQGRMITDWSSGWCESIWKESDLSSVRGEIILSISNEYIYLVFLFRAFLTTNEISWKSRNARYSSYSQFLLFLSCLLRTSNWKKIIRINLLNFIKDITDITSRKILFFKFYFNWN